MSAALRAYAEREAEARGEAGCASSSDASSTAPLVGKRVLIGGLLAFGQIAALLHACAHGFRRTEDDREADGPVARVARRGVMLVMPVCILTIFVFVPRYKV